MTYPNPPSTNEPAEQRGEETIESWDDEPICNFDPVRGFAINPRSLNTLRWYSYLSRSTETGKES